MMSFSGRTVEDNRAHQANCPLQSAAVPTVWARTCGWRAAEISLQPRSGTEGTQPRSGGAEIVHKESRPVW